MMRETDKSGKNINKKSKPNSRSMTSPNFNQKKESGKIFLFIL